ncbi:UDP-2,3-diacylglucosamine diphosphatase LpxI [Roseibacillus ishigakijimensis]|uniref:UDP-2,3-diacylglucosamine diphosphatase LpxI n=2 Tax=Roseibacillus ishigakijimensis TaxID=454146 RepID=A0A934VKL6_9BACT|nr:UDP-2,3-diacylglucosamine diphosphatase LpxI [Roseibacillus ishigakijimensis]
MLAGKGLYPEAFVEGARRQGEPLRLVSVAFHGETDPALESKVDVLEWFRVGQLGKLIKFFLREGVSEIVMVGQITPKNLFEFRPDLRITMALAKLKQRNAETLFGALADEFAKDGITVLPATTFLDHLLPPAGPVLGRELGKDELEAAQYGFSIAKETSRLDIGQSVVVREGTVLAVEAFEGTNECLRRGGALGKGKKVVLAKVSKPKQDMRFDVPVIGPDTIRICAEAGVGAIAIEAGKTLVLGWEEATTLAKKLGVGVIALAGE